MVPVQLTSLRMKPLQLFCVDACTRRHGRDGMHNYSPELTQPSTCTSLLGLGMGSTCANSGIAVHDPAHHLDVHSKTQEMRSVEDQLQTKVNTCGKRYTSILQRPAWRCVCVVLLPGDVAGFRGGGYIPQELVIPWPPVASVWTWTPAGLP